MNDATRLWHPFADQAEVKESRFVVDRAEGVWVFDADGRRYLDATAGLWYCNVGHGRTEIVEAAAAQMRKLDTYFVFNDYTNEPSERLARRLSDLAPMDDATVFLTTGGGESIDTAAKLARQYWTRKGEPQRTHIISRGNAYHGSNGMGTSITGIPANRQGFGDLVTDTSRVAYDDANELATAIETIGPDKVAAFFAEPVIGAGGLYPPPEGYLEQAAKVCEQYGVLFVADSVICGFGRLGTWFGVERWNLRPDMITFAKGVTSGYLPLGGVIVSGRVSEPFWTPGGGPFRHGPTYSGHPTVAAAALANLDILATDGLLERGQELEGPLYATLRGLLDHPAVGEVRGGIGLLGAVEFKPEIVEAEPTVSFRVAKAIRELGMITRPLAKGIAVSPPLSITEDEIETIGKTLSAGLDTLTT